LQPLALEDTGASYVKESVGLAMQGAVPFGRSRRWSEL